MDWNINLPEPEVEEGLVKCSFCNSSQIPEDKAFTGPDVVICQECVALLAAQVDSSPDTVPDSVEGTEPENPRTCNFCQRQRDFAGRIFAGNEKNLYVCFDCVTGFSKSVDQGVS